MRFWLWYLSNMIHNPRGKSFRVTFCVYSVSAMDSILYFAIFRTFFFLFFSLKDGLITAYDTRNSQTVEHTRGGIYNRNVILGVVFTEENFSIFTRICIVCKIRINWIRFSPTFVCNKHVNLFKMNDIPTNHIIYMQCYNFWNLPFNIVVNLRVPVLIVHPESKFVLFSSRAQFPRPVLVTFSTF